VENRRLPSRKRIVIQCRNGKPQLVRGVDPGTAAATSPETECNARSTTGEIEPAIPRDPTIKSNAERSCGRRLSGWQLNAVRRTFASSQMTTILFCSPLKTCRLFTQRRDFGFDLGKSCRSDPHILFPFPHLSFLSFSSVVSSTAVPVLRLLFLVASKLPLPFL